MSELGKSLMQESNGEEQSKLAILITHQPPEYVFSDEWFEVGFNLSSSSPSNIAPEEIELCANIHQNLEGRCQPDPVQHNGNIEIYLKAQSKSIKDSNDESIVRCRIKSFTIQEGGAVAYNINFFQRMKATGEKIEQVEGAMSTKVQVVSFKLSLHCDWDEPVIFYKDEGGKEKHLKTVASLHTNDNSLVKGTHVPLKIALIYDNKVGSNVLRESEILKILDASKHFIDPDTGQCSIKFRLEDVSKNHQGLRFKLLVSPLGSRCVDIGSATSPGISVRSKRNKRSVASFSSSSPPRKKILQQKIYSPEAFHQYTGSVSSTSSPRRDAKAFNSRLENIDLGVAMNKIIEWTDEVIRVLPTLHWTLIGYCQNTDGSVDYNKPNHLMPYPNDCIDRLMKSYSRNVHRCLESTKHEIDQGTAQNTHTRGPMLGPILPNQGIDQNSIYRDYMLSSNFITTPITPNSPMTGGVPAASQFHSCQNHEEEKKRATRQPEMVWRKGGTGDSQEYNELLNHIEYILARHIFSPNGEKLGFPVCDIDKELIGFFRESDVGEGTFHPLSSIEHFDERQISDIKPMLNEAINQRSDAVHKRQDCGTLASLFDHAMVYDWSREFNQQT